MKLSKSAIIKFSCTGVWSVEEVVVFVLITRGGHLSLCQSSTPGAVCNYHVTSGDSDTTNYQEVSLHFFPLYPYQHFKSLNLLAQLLPCFQMFRACFDFKVVSKTRLIIYIEVYIMIFSCSDKLEIMQLNMDSSSCCTWHMKNLLLAFFYIV